MNAGLPDEAALQDGAGLPKLLLKASTYVADLQRRLADARSDQSRLAHERDQLAQQLSVAQRDKAAEVAYLSAENASLQAELRGAADAVEAQTVRLRTMEQQAAERQAAVDAAAASGRQEAARLRALVQQLEEQSRQQAGQLGAVPALQQQLQACTVELEHQRKQAEAAEQRLREEMGALSLERDTFREKYQRYKRTVQVQADAYSIVKEKLRRERSERRKQVCELQASLQAALAGHSQPPQQPQQGFVDAAAAHPPAQSGPSIRGQDSLSNQLHLSVSCPTAAGRTSSHCSGDATAQKASAGADRGQAGITSAPAQPQPSAAPPRCRISSSGRDGRQKGAGDAAAILSPLQRRLEPPPLVEAPPPEEVWPEDEPPQLAPPAVPTPPSDGPDASEGAGLVEPTQAVLPLGGEAVGAHVLDAQPLSLRDRQQLEQQQQQQQQQRRQERQQSTQQHDLAAGPEPSAQAAAPAARQPADPPGARSASQRLPGTGWKQAVRDRSATHSAFELRVPACGDRPRASQPGGVPAPPAREAHGVSKQAPAATGGAGYAYQAVIRKRSEREMLQGVECQQCHRFYSALESWGTIGQGCVRLECGHVQQAPGGGSGGPEALHRGQLMQEGSRHRYLFRPPDTQDGFWDMDVTQRAPPPKRRHEEPAQDGREQLQEPRREPQVVSHADGFHS